MLEQLLALGTRSRVRDGGRGSGREEWTGQPRLQQARPSDALPATGAGTAAAFKRSAFKRSA